MRIRCTLSSINKEILNLLVLNKFNPDSTIGEFIIRMKANGGIIRRVIKSFLILNGKSIRINLVNLTIKILVLFSRDSMTYIDILPRHKDHNSFQPRILMSIVLKTISIYHLSSLRSVFSLSSTTKLYS